MKIVKNFRFKFIFCLTQTTQINSILFKFILIQISTPFIYYDTLVKSFRNLIFFMPDVSISFIEECFQLLDFESLVLSPTRYLDGK